MRLMVFAVCKISCLPYDFYTAQSVGELKMFELIL